MESHKLKCTALMSTHLKFISVVGTLLLRQDRMDEAKTENNADILKEDEMKIVELIMTLPPRKRLLLCMEKMMENKNQGKGMTKKIIPGVIRHTSHPSHSIACYVDKR